LRPFGRLSWTGSRWEVNESPAWHYAEEIGRSLKQKAAAHSNRDEADRIWEHAQQTLDEPRQRRMLSKASHDSRISKRANEFDAQPYLLNVLNGTIDLRTGELREHSREDYVPA
jgi:putative DNA primase/helicase